VEWWINLHRRLTSGTGKCNASMVPALRRDAQFQFQHIHHQVRISDLKYLGWALQIRWVWLQKTEPYRPWANFPFQVPGQVQAFFRLAVVSEVGNGANTLFWADKWLNGQLIADLAPRSSSWNTKKDSK
jgi:hypothetical protein